MVLTLIPCNHYWLTVRYETDKIISICKHPGCRKRGDFTKDEWNQLKLENSALDKLTTV